LPSTYTIDVVGTSGALSHSYPVTLDILQTNDFQISITPQLQSVVQNASTTYTVSVAPVGSFNAPITLNVSGTPSGAMESLSQATLNPGESAVLAVSVGNGVVPGTYPFEVYGTSGAITHAASADLEVVARQYAAELDASKQQFVLDRDGQNNDVALIMNVGELGSSFTAVCSPSEAWIVVDECPGGPYIAGQPSEAQLFSAHVNTTDVRVTPGGSYAADVIITATPHGSTASVSSTPRSIGILYTVPTSTVVIPTVDFGLVVLPQTRAINQGESTNYAVSVTSLGGFNAFVDLTASGLPQGVTTSFAPTQIRPGQAATLTVNSTSSTIPAIYRFNVNGRSSTLGHSYLTELIVNGPGGPIDPGDPNRVRCTFGADPVLIVQPSTSTVLSWSCQNAESCSISPTVGDADPVSGSATVSPTSTTAYVLFCSNNAGSLSIPAQVQVYSSGRIEILPR